MGHTIQRRCTSLLGHRFVNPIQRSNLWGHNRFALDMRDPEMRNQSPITGSEGIAVGSEFPLDGAPHQTAFAEFTQLERGGLGYNRLAGAGPFPRYQSSVAAANGHHPSLYVNVRGWTIALAMEHSPSFLKFGNNTLFGWQHNSPFNLNGKFHAYSQAFSDNLVVQWHATEGPRTVETITFPGFFSVYTEQRQLFVMVRFTLEPNTIEAIINGVSLGVQSYTKFPIWSGFAGVMPPLVICGHPNGTLGWRGRGLAFQAWQRYIEDREASEWMTDPIDMFNESRRRIRPFQAPPVPPVVNPCDWFTEETAPGWAAAAADSGFLTAQGAQDWEASQSASQWASAASGEWFDDKECS